MAKAQVDALEMRNAETRGSLLNSDHAHVAATGTFDRVRSKMLAIFTRVVP